MIRIQGLGVRVLCMLSEFGNFVITFILLDFFAAFIEVPPKECQNAICFGGSLVNVVVPVEVIP